LTYHGLLYTSIYYKLCSPCFVQTAADPSRTYVLFAPPYHRTGSSQPPRHAGRCRHLSIVARRRLVGDRLDSTRLDSISSSSRRPIDVEMSSARRRLGSQVRGVVFTRRALYKRSGRPAFPAGHLPSRLNSLLVRSCRGTDSDAATPRPIFSV